MMDVALLYYSLLYLHYASLCNNFGQISFLSQRGSMVAQIYSQPVYYHILFFLYLMLSTKRTNYSEGNIHFSIDSRYQIEEVLGKGSYGTVCRAVQINSIGEPSRIAIKRVTDIFRREVLLKRAIRELKLMKHFKGHKNVCILVIYIILKIANFRLSV